MATLQTNMCEQRQTNLDHTFFSRIRTLDRPSSPSLFSSLLHCLKEILNCVIGVLCTFQIYMLLHCLKYSIYQTCVPAHKNYRCFAFIIEVITVAFPYILSCCCIASNIYLLLECIKYELVSTVAKY
jgi:hypothetical protein